MTKLIKVFRVVVLVAAVLALESCLVYYGDGDGDGDVTSKDGDGWGLTNPRRFWTGTLIQDEHNDAIESLEGSYDYVVTAQTMALVTVDEIRLLGSGSAPQATVLACEASGQKIYRRNRWYGLADFDIKGLERTLSRGEEAFATATTYGNSLTEAKARAVNACNDLYIGDWCMVTLVNGLDYCDRELASFTERVPVLVDEFNQQLLDESTRR